MPYKFERATVLEVSRMVDLGAYYYLWYDRDQWNVWKSVHTPSHEFYDSSDQETIGQHIGWAKSYGIKFFVVSWAGPDEKRDRNLRKAFLTNPLSQEIKFAILYESDRLKPPDGTLNLDSPEKRKTLIDDFRYLAENYFDDKRYLKIDDKPVVVLYLSRILEGDLSRAISELRSRFKKLYLVGDEVYWGRLSRPRLGRPRLGNLEQRMRLYDAVTAYNMHTSDAGKLADFEKQLESEYKDWSSVLSTIGVDLVPSVIPGFDDTKVPNRDNIPLERKTERLERQVLMAMRYVSKSNLILITSFNEWHEDTQVEPAKDYGEEYLRVIQKCVARP